MDLATCPATAPTAPVRCDERARRIGQVKFRALDIAHQPRDREPAAQALASPPASPYPRLRAILSRVMGCLAAARL